MDTVLKYKSYLADYLSKYHNIGNLKKSFRCLNPEHIDNHPSMSYTDKYDICKCFACGVKYDIFDLVGMDFNLNNFKDKVNKVKEIYSDYTYEIPNATNETKEIKLKDYTNYYKWCINNSYKSTYLKERGISDILKKKYNIGYDEKRKMIIFPITKNCYFGRSTINKEKFKSGGDSEIWNKKHLENSSKNDLIYVTESIIDALSLEEIDPSIKVISINGVTNINTLIKEIKKNNFIGNIVISFDNDTYGIKFQNELKEELTKLNVNSFCNNLIDNFDSSICKDLNQSLILDKEKLKRNYDYFNSNYKNFIRGKGDDLYY